MTSAFMDIRNHGFARVAVCVPAGRVADPEANARAHLELLERAHDAGAQYAICPELGLSGYTCGDLFFQDLLQRGCIDALREIAQRSAAWDMAISVGLPMLVRGQLFNCAATIYGGRVIAIVPKSYPPNYREFYELRWFQPAESASNATVEIDGREVPFGTDILVRLPWIEHFVLHTDVCEDLWVPIPPSTIAALSGATVLGNLSASNITIGKSGYRKLLVESSSAKNVAVQLYSAAGFGESTTDLAWDGHGLVADRGEIVAETARFTASGSLAVSDIDLQALVTDRARQSSWGENAKVFGRQMREVVPERVAEARDESVYERLERRVNPHPFAPEDPRRLDERCEEVFQILATSLAQRLQSLPASLRKVVIGISGGRDSTLALLVAVRAFDHLGLSRKDITGVTMPGFGTSEKTKSIARSLVTSLGATLREVEITGISTSVFEAIGHDPDDEDTTFENVQAWTRKFIEFSVASDISGIDLGTSDLSELALGWTTYGGDHMSHYGVNAGVPKTLVSQVIRWSADTVFASEPEVAETLAAVLGLPISPELRRLSSEGTIVQLSEEMVGPYELADFFLYYFTRFGYRPQRIARMALQAFEGRYTLAEIKSWLTTFIQRFFASQFKRDCVPAAPKVGSGGTLSPRGDWRMPADAAADAWLRDVALIPDSI